ncbi:MAG: ribosome small subunit-dependent GTPase A [Marinifilaceae bacterium]
MQKGVVIKSTGSWYTVLMADGEQVACRLRGKIRIAGIRSTNPIAVGDGVNVEIDGEDGVITSILPRRNYIIRRSTNLSKESHILAANVDQALLVVTVANPETSTVFIDRFLATAEAYNIPAIIVFNKMDLYDEDNYAYVMGLTAIYEQIGYKCIHCSTITGKGVDEVRALLKDKITVLSGLSGVGKSSLINKVEPGLDLKTASISDAHKSGKHTTTFAEMFPLSEGGFIVDTPGVRSFGTIDMSKQELSHFFPEIFKISDECRFNNCTHTHEPGCAVREAVEADEISESRYCSYLSMFEEEEENKYRKG